MGLVSTNDNCIGCNSCIKVCGSMGANVAIEKGRGNVIDVDPARCIACGACLDACEHQAREYVDDVPVLTLRSEPLLNPFNRIIKSLIITNLIPLFFFVRIR